MNYVDMMEGAGLGDVLRPQEEFMKEHERLVELLSDKKEGGSGKSNFIARLMAEQKYKHRDASEKDKPYEQTKTGKYRKPVMDPEVDDTTMSQAIKFDYNKIANKNQVRSGENRAAYGASPFIAHHFGLAQSASKPKETAAQSAARRAFSGREERVEPKGFLSASDKEPQSRPKNITKKKWLDYLNSKTYQNLLEQRELDAAQRARNRR
jgi:hypothetical protein